MKAAADGIRAVSLELGGKNPGIVFADCDLDAAAAGIARAAFLNTGQVCLGTERVYVERPIFERFVAALKDKAQALSRVIRRTRPPLWDRSSAWRIVRRCCIITAALCRMARTWSAAAEYPACPTRWPAAPGSSDDLDRIARNLGRGARRDIRTVLPHLSVR